MDPLSDEELSAILRKLEASPAPAALEARISAARRVPHPWWRRASSNSVRIPVPVLVLAVLTFLTLGIAAFRVNRPVVPPSGNTWSAVRESKPAIAPADTDGQSGPSQGSPRTSRKPSLRKMKSGLGGWMTIVECASEGWRSQSVDFARTSVPGDARAGALEGVVRLQVRIGTDGRISDTTVLSGNPTLTTAAIEAVKKRVYRPTLLNGMPIAVITQVNVTFRTEVILTSSLMH